MQDVIFKALGFTAIGKCITSIVNRSSISEPYGNVTGPVDAGDGDDDDDGDQAACGAKI